MRNYGFTLIEVLVAMTVFALIMLVSVSVFVYALDLQRRAFNLQQGIENANFVLESITKELRISEIAAPFTDDTCPASPMTVLAVTNTAGESIRFFLENGNVIREVNETRTTMNSNTIAFSRFDFCVSGAESDVRQPRVTIRAVLKTTNTKNPASVDIQTTLSLRMLSP